MPHQLLAVFGIASGIFNVAGLVPYIRDIFRSKTKPERAMWWIYAFLFGVLFAAQVGAGAHWVLVITAASILSSVVIAALSLRYGYGSFHRRDAVSLCIAIVGLVGWMLTNNPLLAIIMVVIVDIAGFWLTLVKTWKAPHSETLISWQLSFLAAIASVLSAGTWNFSVLLYPLYSVIGTGMLVWLIMYRRLSVKEDPADF